ncbi:hypothetical protein LOTGIDRAFT_165229 [Lottia gigantea]|uniref:Large subunit GTPase 1 homolog n=1 Tax=Lottia gigantea TaxID=225164 RepID=V3ZWN4_LOTGI|nr:hypothetical protein LOTGIDRAFT_165229 [Lottia gigantea]ESO88812.1 hypothetical protein LOTGIDRAFT_165229 [Lottia gigantea]
MGKNSKKSGQPMLGRTIIKDRFRGKNKSGGTGGKQNYLHTTELNDGYDWGRLNLQSVTEQSNLEDFLSTAELAGTEFTAEKLNVKFVDPAGNIGLLSSEEKEKVHEAQQKHRNLLSIPRRPAWTEKTTGEELEMLEKESFLQWRKLLAKLQEEEHIIMTPFEKNLDFWRQLWRVIERSDIIVQIVDGRNPLLFRCSDLDKYVKEVNKSKVNLLLINKADYLTSKQRERWSEYFSKHGVKIAFWSALEETTRQTESKGIGDTKTENSATSSDKVVNNSSNILCGEELLELLKSLHTGPYHTDHVLTVGMVGYPNVGKSSTINAILKTKKVPVSATPGRTKHFQTLYVEPDLMLCDCPGLVFPSFVSTKAEIPRHVLEIVYGINIRKPGEGEDPNRKPNAYELLNAYGAMRGYMTSRGAPDGPRSARYIIKDYINGKILYCHPPPGIESSDFQEVQTITKYQVKIPIPEPQVKPDTSTSKTQTKSSSLDKEFFSKMYAASHVKGVKCIRVAGRPDLSTPYSSQQSLNTIGEKPWRHHHNKNKKEKLRKVYSHLDQHDYY